MHSRLSRQQTRRIASVLLFGWLFALVASWANACVLQPESAGHHPERSGLVAPYDAGEEAAAGARGSHPLDPAQLTCASFCNAEQTTITTKAKKSKVDDASQHPAWVPSVSAGWLAFTPGRAEVRWRPLTASPLPGPPIAIVFLRLTL